MLLEPLFGSLNRERVLIYLLAREEGYARQISRFFDVDYFPVREQLKRLETDGVLISRELGRTVVYQFNPRYVLLDELHALLEKALSFYPAELKEKLQMNRRRPRRRGKPG